MDPTIKKEVVAILNSNDISDLSIKNGKLNKSTYLSRMVDRLTNKGKNEEVQKRANVILGSIVVKDASGKKLDVEKTRANLQSLAMSLDDNKQEMITGVFLMKVSNFYESEINKLKSIPEEKLSESNKSKLDDLKSGLSDINMLKRDNLKEELGKDENYTELRTTKNELKQAVKMGDTSPETQRKLLEAKTETKVAKMQMLYRMGETGKSEKGTTGTALVFDYRTDGTKRLLGVLKPDGAYAPAAVRLGNIARKIFGQLSLLPKGELAQPNAENVSYKASQFFGLGGTPPSKIVTVNGIKGVFQMAAQSVVKTAQGDVEKTSAIHIREAEDLMKPKIDTSLIDPNRKFSEKELELFQRFIIHDFLIGNLDAKGENWFVRQSPDGEITQIIGIDKANSFPEKNPGALGIGGLNQYKWKNLPIANQPFSQEMKDLMKNITSDKVDEFIIDIKKNNEGFITPEMEKLFKERAGVLREIGELGGAITPARLAQIVTDDDFKKWETQKEFWKSEEPPVA